jgi:hypothetical protein
MPRVRYTINNMPLRGSLTTAGQQGTIPEAALWQAENCYADLDGTISKRPGLGQWGQTIQQPVGTDGFTFYEMFKTLNNWNESENTNKVRFSAVRNKLNVNVLSEEGSTTTEIIGRAVTGTQEDSDDADWSLRFSVQTTGMPTDGQFIVSAKARAADDPYAIRIRGAGVDVYTGSWTELATYALSDAGVSTFEIRFDADGNMSVYVNDELLGTSAVSGLTAYSAMTEGDYLEFHFNSYDVGVGGDSLQYTIYITDLMMDGAAEDAFEAERLGAGTDFKTIAGGAAVRRSLLVSGEKYLYVDNGLKKLWSPLLELVGPDVSFAQVKDDLIIFAGDTGFSSKVYRWDGKSDPVLLDDAPNVRFGTEHRTRIFAAGDKRYPLRVYFTASRQPNVWFAPETDADGQEELDEVLDAGYITMPGKRGDEVVAVYGEFYGSCIVATNRGIWRITGSSPLSYTVENISQDTGAAAQRGVERVGNDLWMVGRQGITTLQTVQQFGDMKAAMPSGPIADLWETGVSNSEIKVSQLQLYKASMAWNPTLSLLYFAFAATGASDVSSIYVYNPVTQGWLGPWDTDTTFVESVEIASPVVQSVMHGTSVGKVALTRTRNKTDFGVGYTMKVESAYLNGRSLDPSLQHQMKTWKTLRLFIQPRGDWDLNVRWQADDGTYQSIVESQNVFDLQVLGVDFRLGVDPDGRLHSGQMIGCIEIPLDVRGRYFKFDVSTADDVAGEDFILQGYEVEFLADGPDQEQQ